MSAARTGSRFGYWIGDAALLALALYRLALDRLVAKGFVPVLPPVRSARRRSSAPAGCRR
jgi:seryl-tRNA synthetase